MRKLLFFFTILLAHAQDASHSYTLLPLDGSVGPVIFRDLGTHSVGFQAPNTVTSSGIWILPALSSAGCLYDSGSFVLSQVACGSGNLTFVTSDPSGSCTVGAPMQYNTTSGILWGCHGGTWAAQVATDVTQTITAVKTFNATINTQNIIPTTDNTYAIGNTSHSYAVIYVNNTDTQIVNLTDNTYTTQWKIVGNSGNTFQIQDNSAVGHITYELAYFPESNTKTMLIEGHLLPGGSSSGLYDLGGVGTPGSLNRWNNLYLAGNAFVAGLAGGSTQCVQVLTTGQLQGTGGSCPTGGPFMDLSTIQTATALKTFTAGIDANPVNTPILQLTDASYNVQWKWIGTTGSLVQLQDNSAVAHFSYQPSYFPEVNTPTFLLDGHLLPANSSSGLYDLGGLGTPGSLNRWRNLYLSGDAFITSLGGSNIQCIAGLTTGALQDIGNCDVWTSWTPTLTASSGSATLNSSNCRYAQDGKMVHYRCKMVLSVSGASVTYVNASLPVAEKDDDQVASGYVLTNGSTFATSTNLAFVVFSTNVFQMYQYPWSSSFSPYTVYLEGIYEAN